MADRDIRRDSSPPSRSRKTVSLLFADLAGSTELGERLDPEALQAVVARYGDAMRGVVEHHGGRVEKFIGDAVMAVFGIPVLHEDDALRAVRAALDMGLALERLNRELEQEYDVVLRIRIGVNTGEVITGELEAEQALVAGDAVNTAARLQAAAPTGAVLIGPETLRLVRGSVRARAHGQITLRGKQRPVRAWVVDAVAPPRPALGQARRSPVVGRRRELRRLETRFARACERKTCGVALVLGAAGVGKSTLAREFVQGLGGAARVVVGRCLPYGEGITYWPLREIVEQLGGADALPQRLAGDRQAQSAASVLASAVGQTGTSASAPDVQWALRRLLESVARRRPLVVAFDDLHWAEPALLDLVEHLGRHVAAPVMVAAIARDDLLERRPAWAGTFGRGSVIRLRPLSPVESRRLLRNLVARHGHGHALARDDVLDAAGGNPLFLEQLVAMRRDEPGRRTPPTVQALLAARVDGLPPGERRVIEAAAVEGREFHTAALAALLAPGDDDVEAALRTLTRRQLVSPGPAAIAGETGYRFAHMLVRDAAYELLPKRRRAELHLSFAGWLAAQSARRSADLDEIVGYHLEQAHGYRAEIGRPDAEPQRELARRASRHLGSAGRRAQEAADRAAAANLLRRAAALLPDGDREQVRLLVSLGGVLRDEGHFVEAARAVSEAIRHAAALGDAPLEARARVERLLNRLQIEPEAVGRAMSRRGPALVTALEGAGDHAGLARVWHLRALLAWIRAQTADAGQAWRHAAEEARLAGDASMLADAIGWEASSVAIGPAPAEAGIRRCGQICAMLDGNPWAHALALQPLASLHGMRGEFEAAYALLDASNATLADFEPSVDAAVSYAEVQVTVLAGDLDRAERHLRRGRRLLEQMGERAVLASTEGYLAQVMLLRGRVAEADRLARRSAAMAAPEDAWPQVVWRLVRARVLASRGRTAQAAALAREGVAIAATTDLLNLQGDAWSTLAGVAADRPVEGDAARACACGCYERKGNVVQLDALRSPRDGGATEAHAGLERLVGG